MERFANVLTSFVPSVQRVHGPANYSASAFTADGWFEFALSSPVEWDGFSHAFWRRNVRDGRAARVRARLLTSVAHLSDAAGLGPPLAAADGALGNGAGLARVRRRC